MVKPQIIERLINRNHTKGRGNNKITGVVLHTEGVPQKIENNNDRSLYPWFDSIEARVSSHFYITFSGKIEQYVRLEDTAWHTVGDGNQNAQTVGIEHQDNGYWDTGSKYTSEQYEASAQLLALLHESYGFALEHRKAGGVAIHRDHDPKPCPGALDFIRIIKRAKEIISNKTDNLYHVVENGKQVGAFRNKDNAFDKWYSCNKGENTIVTLTGKNITSEFQAMVNEMNDKILELTAANVQLREANQKLENSNKTLRRERDESQSELRKILSSIWGKLYSIFNKK